MIVKEEKCNVFILQEENEIPSKVNIGGRQLQYNE